MHLFLATAIISHYRRSLGHKNRKCTTIFSVIINIAALRQIGAATISNWEGYRAKNLLARRRRKTRRRELSFLKAQQKRQLKWLLRYEPRQEAAQKVIGHVLKLGRPKPSRFHFLLIMSFNASRPPAIWRRYDVDASRKRHDKVGV